MAALPTIRYLLERGAAVIACSHLGKPKGQRKESLSLAPVAVRLSELLGQEVIFAKDVTGEDAKAKAAALQPGQILLLENGSLTPVEPQVLSARWPEGTADRSQKENVKSARKDPTERPAKRKIRRDEKCEG